VVKATGNDAVNKFAWKAVLDNPYPHGGKWAGDDAVPTTWTEDATFEFAFLVEGASGLLQSGGEFDGLLSFAEGAPTNESRAIVRPLKDFWNDEEFTLRLVTSELTASKTLLDANMGLLHKNRIRLYTSGNFLIVKVYEADGTVHSIIDGTTNMTSAGTYDIVLAVRSKGDGSDYVKLYVNGSAEGTALSAQTITFDDLLVESGHVTLGGGFPAPPTWDKDFKTDQFAGGNLPSNDADTAWGGVATEAQAMQIINNNVMIQNKSGYTSLQDGYYDCGITTFDNAVGTSVVAQVQVVSDHNITTSPSVELRLDDGTKRIRVNFHEYYMEAYDGAAYNFYQVDLTDKLHTVQVDLKGSDARIYLDGRLVLDLAGKITWASAAEGLYWGDATTDADKNSDAIWSEVLIYDGGLLNLEVNDCELSEFAYWHGDQTGILAQLYNSGSLLSVKKVCGIKQNYISRFDNVIRVGGITTGPVVATTTRVTIPEMQLLTLLSDRPLRIEFDGCGYHTAAGGYFYYEIEYDGGWDSEDQNLCKTSASYYAHVGGVKLVKKPLCGLHPIKVTWYAVAANATMYNRRRGLTVKQ
jgi:hypothetical protein